MEKIENINHIIFIDENIPYLQEALNQCGTVIKYKGRNLTNTDLILGNCSVLFVRSTVKVNEALLTETNIKFVGTATSGYDNIDINYLKEHNIDFAYAPGSNANSVAEYVVFSMLKWANINNTSLKDKIIGIIGFGNIGKIVAKYASNFNMKVLINDPPLKKTGNVFPAEYEYTEIADIFSNSDIVTNHVPLTNAGEFPTENLISRKLLSLLKNHTLFIHVSRGGVVDEETLTSKLHKKMLFVSIDVWENEPLFNVNLAKSSILATPHIAGYSREGKLRGSFMMANAINLNKGKRPSFDIINNKLSTYVPLDIGYYSDENYIFNLLQNTRKLDDDSEAFLELCNLPLEKRSLAFDKLRKNYPVRREIL